MGEQIDEHTDMLSSASLTLSSRCAVLVCCLLQTIAQRLVQSKRDIPHYYLNVDINMDNIIRWGVPYIVPLSLHTHTHTHTLMNRIYVCVSAIPISE